MLTLPNQQKLKQVSVPEIKVIPVPSGLQSRKSNRMMIFTKSNSRNSIQRAIKSKNSVGINNNLFPIMKKRTGIIRNYNYSEEMYMKEIYNDFESEENSPELIKKFLAVEDCSIIKYGLNQTYETIEFSFCRTCDPNLINPICAACINVCHKSHKIKKKFIKGEIKCICGERLHCMSNTLDLTVNNNSCQLGEWYIISKINFFYKTNGDSCLCMLCYNFCNKNINNNENNDNIIKLNENDPPPNCICNNEEIHQEKKKFFEKIDEIAANMNNFIYFNLFHPSQIINMIFLSKKQFQENYSDLIYVFDLFLKENFAETSQFNSFKKLDFSNTICSFIFNHLLNFIKWNKYNDMTFFCKEANDYFSLKMMKLILSAMEPMKHNEKSFWVLSAEFLKLFNKIYIGNFCQGFSKFKLNDLENFSCSLRWTISHLNILDFPESQEIINDLISFLTKINISEITSIEAFSTIEIIITIFRKMSKYNLITNINMTKIVQETDKILIKAINLRKSLTKNDQQLIKINNERRNSINKKLVLISEKEFKLYYVIIKLLYNFNICYNDKLINDTLLNNNGTYTNLESINATTITFSFVKSELGRALLKLTIVVLYTLQTEHIYFHTHAKYRKIIQFGMKILRCYLLSNDSYMLSIIQSLHNMENYEKMNLIDIKLDSDYQEILTQKKALDNTYYKYLNFEIDLDGVIFDVRDSLNKVIDQHMYGNIDSEDEDKIINLEEKKIICILKTKYYFSLSKFFRILEAYETKISKLPKELLLDKKNMKEEYKDELTKLIKKIYSFYKSFIYESCDNSLIILSYYTFKDLCKAPINYGLLNFHLFYDCVININNTFHTIGNSIVYILELFEYLELLRKNDFIHLNECLYIFIDILEIFILKMKSMDLEENIKEIKNMMINLNSQYKIIKVFYDNKANLKEDGNFDKCFLSYIKLINSVFDFTNEENKNDAANILNVEKAIYAIKYYNIGLDLRTEFLKYIRKINIDLSFNKNSNMVYTNSIVSIEDNLVLLKTNPLITNFRYPTRFLSYFKDFVNLSVKSEFTDQLNKSLSESNSSSEMKSPVYSFKVNKKKIKTENTQSKNMNINIIQLKEEKTEKEEKNKNTEEESSESDEEKENSNKIIAHMKNNEDILKSNSSSKKIMKPVFDNETYDVFLNELTNLKDIIGDIKVYEETEMESLRNYFENGLLIPIIYYLRKAFVFAHCFSGKEMLKVYELLIESCNLRLYIAEYKHNFWDEDNDNNDYKVDLDNYDINNLQILNYIVEKENFCRVYNNKAYLINGSFCVNYSLNEMTEKALNSLQKRKFLCFDFTTLYDIFEKHLLTLLKDRKENNYGEFFNDEDREISLKSIENEENDLIPSYKYLNEKQKKIIRLYMIYNLCKKYYLSNENNSSLFSILPELCLEYETNFRNLLITFLVNNGIKNEQFYDQLNLAFPLLYKLLNLQTGETQNTLINLIGGNNTDSSNLGFMSEFSQYLFKRITLLFIELFNVPDKLFDVNYVFSFLLIKIFKFLCEEHNNFFQCRLIKILYYNYIEEIPMYFKETSIEDDDPSYPNKIEESISEDSSKKKENIKSVKFFDFFLHVIIKIMLISEWNKLDNIEENITEAKQNKYLYDIFSAILEMLNEIIQGSRPEFLNHLGNSIYNNKSNDFEQYLLGEDLSNNPVEFEYREIEKVDSLQYFVKTVTEIIFSDINTLDLVYKIKNDLMQFLITILEEKNCNEEIQKFIIKYLNINRVFSTISSILKNFYVMLISNEEDDNSTTRTNTNNTDAMNYAKTLFTLTEFKKYQTLSENKNGKNENDNKKLLINNWYFRSYIIEKNKLIFDDKLLDYYKQCYFYGELNKSYQFQLSNIFYKYIKLIAVLNKSDEAKNLIERAETLKEENAKRKFRMVHNDINKNKNKKINQNEQFTDLIFKKKYGTILKQKPKSPERSLNESEFINININKDNKIKNIEREKILNNLKITNITDKETKFDSLINENINEVDKDEIEHYYIIKFFESITKTVEIRTEEAINQTVIFTKPQEMIYLSKGTKSEFEREVNRDSETNKKYDLLTHVTYFQKEINYYQIKQSKLAQLISNIDFRYVQVCSYIYFLILNLLMLFTLKGDISITDENSYGVELRRKNSEEIKGFIDTSLSRYNNTYNILCYSGVFINGLFILIWLYFRLPLYFKIDRLKYMKIYSIAKEEHLSFFERIYIIIFMTIVDRGYILTLVFEFLFSLIGALLKNGEIIYAFLLLPIMHLNKILKNIIISLKLFYSELSLTFFFMVVIIYIFSNFAFFFFNGDYEKTIEYKDDNLCKTLVFCFLNAMDSGLRARGGIGDSGRSISFLTNKNHYLKRIIMDDIFFIIIVIIAIDIVFGIIIRGFSKLRDEDEKHENDKKNHCFICHVNKNSVEKNRQNFEEHRNKIHYLWNYVDYMITLKFSDVHDLNAINSYVCEKLGNKDISWLPTYKDLEIKGHKGDNDEFEEDLKVEEENVIKYFIKEC